MCDLDHKSRLKEGSPVASLNNQKSSNKPQQTDHKSIEDRKKYLYPQASFPFDFKAAWALLCLFYDSITKALASFFSLELMYQKSYLKQKHLWCLNSLASKRQKNPTPHVRLFQDLWRCRFSMYLDAHPAPIMELMNSGNSCTRQIISPNFVILQWLSSCGVLVLPPLWLRVICSSWTPRWNQTLTHLPRSFRCKMCACSLPNEDLRSNIQCLKIQSLWRPDKDDNRVTSVKSGLKVRLLQNCGASGVSSPLPPWHMTVTSTVQRALFTQNLSSVGFLATVCFQHQFNAKAEFELPENSELPELFMLQKNQRRKSTKSAASLVLKMFPGKNLHPIAWTCMKHPRLFCDTKNERNSIFLSEETDGKPLQPVFWSKKANTLTQWTVGLPAPVRAKVAMWTPCCQVQKCDSFKRERDSIPRLSRRVTTYARVLSPSLKRSLERQTRQLTERLGTQPLAGSRTIRWRTYIE